MDPSVLEPIAARAWPSAETAALGGWRLYAAAGFSGRLNACWPLAAPEGPVDEAVAAVEAWYAARGLPPIFKLADGATVPDHLTEALAARGYRARTETLVMTAILPAGDVAAAPVSPQLDDGFLAVFSATAHDPGDARERIEALQRIAPPRFFARIDAEGEPAAIGACAVEGEWAGIFAMRTVPAHRRQGLAGRILDALFAAARGAGARRAYLQVEASNDPAVTLYRGLGFETAYAYRYWDRPL